MNSDRDVVLVVGTVIFIYVALVAYFLVRAFA